MRNVVGSNGVVVGGVVVGVIRSNTTSISVVNVNACNGRHVSVCLGGVVLLLMLVLFVLMFVVVVVLMMMVLCGVTYN